jgi:hypothetical protein
MYFVEIYRQLIAWISTATALDDTILHIHAGMAILLLARIVTGRSLATLTPLLCVCAAEFANEAMDYLAIDKFEPDALGDIVATIFWPTTLFVLARWYARRDARPDDEAEVAIPADSPSILEPQ